MRHVTSANAKAHRNEPDDLPPFLGSDNAISALGSEDRYGRSLKQDPVRSNDALFPSLRCYPGLRSASHPLPERVINEGNVLGWALV